MKVAVFSDVQANLPAMETCVAHIQSWHPDLVVMAGDLINRGPTSAACLTLFQELRQDAGWLPILGNHEVWVMRCGREPPMDSIDARLRALADFTHAQIAGTEHWLANWPDHLCFEGESGLGWVHVTHGTLLGNRDGISARTQDADLPAKVPGDVDLFVTGHTHRPLIRHFQGIDILNVGSVGSPFDEDVRASYGQLEWHGGRWHIRIIRLDYDRAAAERAFSESGFLDRGGPLARIVFAEWLRARPLINGWHQRYGEAVRGGLICPDRAVDEYLRSLP
jgi:predicted phosphodiesterase